MTGCGGGIPSIAEKNKTFYAYDSASKEMIDLFETPYPPLDKQAEATQPEYHGVSVLAGHVHVSRPTEWILRKAGNEPGRRFVQYVSPKEYVFAVYEWPDLPDAPWREVIGRYEDAAKESHAELLEQRVPMATWNAQARACACCGQECKGDHNNAGNRKMEPGPAGETQQQAKQKLKLGQ